MDCPKCHASMQEVSINTFKGPVVIDRCTQCKGLWFDLGEVELLKKQWMSDYVDSGDRKVGKEQNKIRDIKCPRCGKPMAEFTDPKQPHIQYEGCEEHGLYFDAGEFTDYKYETLMDYFRAFIAALRP